jgi:AraC-like DNA-binding protein
MKHGRSGRNYAARTLRAEALTAANCRLFLRELRARGIDYRRPLALLGIRDPDEGGPTQFLSPVQISAFLALCEELAKDPAIGLHAGARMQLSDMGLFGLLLRSSANGQSAYSHYSAYRGTLEDVANVEVSILDGVVVCRRGDRGIEPSRVLSEYFAASTVSCTRQLQGAVEPLEVRLMYPAPADTHEHVRLLGRRLRFGEREDAVVFSSELLSRDMLHHDPLTAEVLQRHIARLPHVSEPRASDLISQTRRLIANGLSRNQTTMPEVAELLQMRERTLRRKLQELGTSFQTLLDEVRRDRALHYMRESRYSTPELSSQLGFNGPAAFYRAFRRWTGSSWSKYRDEHLHAFHSAELAPVMHSAEAAPTKH